MQARIELPGRAFPGQDRLARRSAVWALFLRSLYGPPRGASIGGLDPDELPDVEALGSLTRTQLVARPQILRRLLAPLILARSPHGTRWSPEFRELVIAALRDESPPPEDFTDALERLRTWGRKRFAIKLHGPVADRDIRAATRLFAPDSLLEVEPTNIRSEDGIFTVSRHARLKAPLRAVRLALDPRNWMSMGEFFESVTRVPGEFEEREDGGWHGLFEEHFVVGFGPLLLNSVRPVLHVDYTFDDERVRSDYSLAYERDDQLECDDGYAEAKSIPGRLGWVDYYAEKSTRFRSPVSNLYSSTVAAVFLESNLSSVEDAAFEELQSANHAGTP